MTELRRKSDITAISTTINCTIGAYAACERGLAYWRAQGKRAVVGFCDEACAFAWSGAARPASICGMSQRMKLDRALDAFAKNCKPYAAVPYTAELLEDISYASQRLTHAEYLSQGMGHRFCLVAPGDYPSTHKVSEALVLGAAGGCIPVFVVPGHGTKNMPERLARWLPYSRWLDYCEVSYLIPENEAQHSLGQVLSRLRAVSEREASAKLQALRLVRAAFTFTPDPSMQKPSAAHYIINEACQAARRFLSHETGPERVAGGDHSRCMLLSKKYMARPDAKAE